MKVNLPTIFEDLRWQFCSKEFLETFTRPGTPLRTRFKMGLGLLSQGYAGSTGGELAVRQVPGPRGEKTFQAISPDTLRKFLLDLEVEAFRAAGRELSREERKARMIKGDATRAVLEYLEDHDGTITRVRCLNPKKLEGLTYDDAVKQGLCVPIRDLGLAERRKLNGKCFIFVHVVPRAASLEALTRHVEDEQGAASEKTEHQEKETAFVSADQLCLDLGTEFGVNADLLKAHPGFRKEMERYAAIDSTYNRMGLAKERQRLKMRGMAELIAREQGKPSITGEQKDFNFARKSSLPAKPDKPKKPNSSPNESDAEREYHERLETGSAHAGVQASASLNLTGKETNSSAGGNDTSTTPSRRDAENIPLVSQPRSAEAYQILKVMRQYVPRTDAKAAEDLLRACRNHAPTCTVVQILAEIEDKGPIVPKNADYPAKYLSSCVARMFDGGAPPERIQPARVVARCSACGRDVEGETVVNGQCGDCLAAHYETAPMAAAGD